jgi:hypothetical protein
MGDMPLVALASVVAAAALLVSPAPVTPGASTFTTSHVPSYAPPPVDAKADYQLGGNYSLPHGVRVVSRDRLAAPAASAYTLCYVNAFQTQPGQLRWWKAHHPRVLLRVHGQLRHDPGWPGEVLLDTSTAAKRQEITRVLGRWIDRCAKDGFRAVEPDNLDSFSRSKGRLTRNDNLLLATQLATRAHQAGLAIAQKNMAGLTRDRRQRIGFDFAVAEECSRWNECGSYRAAYGRHVIEIEYSDNGRRWFTRACRDHGGRWSIIYRDRNLVTPSHAAYVYDSC